MLGPPKPGLDGQGRSRRPGRRRASIRVGLESRGEGRRRRFGGSLDRPSAGRVPGHEELEQPARALDSTRWTGRASRNSLAMTDAREAGAGARSRGAQPGVPSRCGDLAPAVLVDLDRLVVERIGQVRAVRPEPGRRSSRPACPSRRRTRAARTGRAGRGAPDLVELAGDSRAEDRMGLRRGQEVARSVRADPLDPVVAVLRVVQGDRHEPGEGQRPRRADLGPDLLEQEPGRCRSAGGRVGRPIAEAGLDRVRAGRLIRRPTSRTPGPTSEWPPSRIGICAVPAGRRSARAARDRRSRPAEQVRREAVLGRGPARLVGAQPVRKQDPAVDEGRVAELGQPGAERRRAVAVEEQPRSERGGRWGGPTGDRDGRLDDRRPRSSTRARTRQRALPSSQAEGRRGGPAGDDELGRWGRPAPARTPARRSMTTSSSGSRPGSSRRADPARAGSGRAASRDRRRAGCRPAGGRRPSIAGPLREPARQRVVAGEIARQRGSQSTSATARMSAEKRLLASARAGRRRRHRPRTSVDRPASPAGSPPSRGSTRPPRAPRHRRGHRLDTPGQRLARRLPNGRPSGGPATSRTVVRPGPREAQLA